MAIPHWVLFSGLTAYLLKDKTVSRAREAIYEWEPEEAWEREADYRSDLADYLREELPETFVVEEYGKGRGRKDIRIENRDSSISVGVELKYDLSSSNEVNRLLGQALRYSEDVDVLFIILINCEKNHLSEIEKYISRTFEEDSVEVLILEVSDEED